MAAGPMYDQPLAPSTMGREFINSARKPLSEYVGASQAGACGRRERHTHPASRERVRASRPH